METLKRCSAQAGAMNKVFNKLQKTQAYGDMLLNAKRHIAYLTNLFETYKQIRDELAANYPEDIDPAEEEIILNQQAELVFQETDDLRDSAINLERKISEHPTLTLFPMFQMNSSSSF